MRAFLRRNLFIVLGVALPLSLIALVLVVQSIHRSGVAPPVTPVVYVYRADVFLRQHLEIDVRDGTLSMAYRVPDSEPAARQLSGSTFELALHDPRTGRTEHHAFDVPDDDGNAESPIPLTLPESLTGLVLDGSPVSPDGFRLRTRSRSGGGLFAGLFGYRSYGVRYELVKDEVGFDLPGEAGYGMRDALIGWVVER